MLRNTKFVTLRQINSMRFSRSTRRRMGCKINANIAHSFVKASNNRNYCPVQITISMANTTPLAMPSLQRNPSQNTPKTKPTSIKGILGNITRRRRARAQRSSRASPHIRARESKAHLIAPGQKEIHHFRPVVCTISWASRCRENRAGVIKCKTEGRRRAWHNDTHTGCAFCHFCNYEERASEHARLAHCPSIPEEEEEEEDFSVCVCVCAICRPRGPSWDSAQRPFRPAARPVDPGDGFMRVTRATLPRENNESRGASYSVAGWMCVPRSQGRTMPRGWANTLSGISGFVNIFE